MPWYLAWIISSRSFNFILSNTTHIAYGREYWSTNSSCNKKALGAKTIHRLRECILKSEVWSMTRVVEFRIRLGNTLYDHPFGPFLKGIIKLITDYLDGSLFIYVYATANSLSDYWFFHELNPMQCILYSYYTTMSPLTQLFIYLLTRFLI